LTGLIATDAVARSKALAALLFLLLNFAALFANDLADGSGVPVAGLAGTTAALTTLPDTLLMRLASGNEESVREKRIYKLEIRDCAPVLGMTEPSRFRKRDIPS
jgi:hypothetical protein